MDASLAYPATWYAETATLPPQRPAFAGETDTDVCIVGGGFAGLWTALELARRGWSVILLEEHRIGWGASGRNGGFVSAGYSQRLDKIVERVGREQARALLKLSVAGREAVRAFAEAHPGRDIHPVSGRLTVQRRHDRRSIQRAFELRRELGIPAEIWETDQVREVLRTKSYHQALVDAEGFHIQPLNLALALADACEALGVKIHEGSRATGMDLAGLRKFVEVGQGRIRARDVVFCGSAHLAPLYPKLSEAVLPVATYAAVTEKLGERLHEAVRFTGAVADTRRAGDYYRIVDGDRLLWGGRITTRTSAPFTLSRMLKGDIAAVYPQLGEVTLDHAWTGIMGYAVHLMPQIGQLAPGVWTATAFGGHGLAATAMAGQVLSRAIIERDRDWRAFLPFGVVWAGGALGRTATQFSYWRMQVADRIEEWSSRRYVRKLRREEAAMAAWAVAARDKLLAQPKSIPARGPKAPAYLPPLKAIVPVVLPAGRPDPAPLPAAAPVVAQALRGRVVAPQRIQPKPMDIPPVAGIPAAGLAGLPMVRAPAVLPPVVQPLARPMPAERLAMLEVVMPSAAGPTVVLEAPRALPASAPGLMPILAVRMAEEKPKKTRKVRKKS